MRDLKNNLYIQVLLDLADTEGGDAESAILDLVGYRSAVLAVIGNAAGIGVGDKIVFSVLHGDEADDLGPIASGDLQGSFAEVTADGPICQWVGYIGGKRYIQVTATVTGTLTASFLGVYAVVDHAFKAPVGAPAVVET